VESLRGVEPEARHQTLAYWRLERELRETRDKVFISGGGPSRPLSLPPFFDVFCGFSRWRGGVAQLLAKTEENLSLDEFKEKLTAGAWGLGLWGGRGCCFSFLLGRHGDRDERSDSHTV
jgi:hypothetical protein